jgi:transposase-like protein
MSGLAALRITRGDDAVREKIVAAIKRAKGHRGEAAKALDVSESTLYRFIEDLEMTSTLEKLAKDHGFHTGPGRKPPFKKEV